MTSNDDDQLIQLVAIIPAWQIEAFGDDGWKRIEFEIKKMLRQFGSEAFGYPWDTLSMPHVEIRVRAIGHTEHPSV